MRYRPAGHRLLVTTNTDFAETEVDVRQINTNRFLLFFQGGGLFLEDAGIFDSDRRPTGAHPLLLPAHRPGDGGEVVPIGREVPGRVGDWTIGALDTYVGSGRARGRGHPRRPGGRGVLASGWFTPRDRWATDGKSG